MPFVYTSLEKNWMRMAVHALWNKKLILLGTVIKSQ